MSKQGALRIRFTRFAGVALVSLATSELTLALCDGVFHLTATPAGVSSWLTGAVVSYLLSRWAWERKGKPDVLRETVPFWAISALVVVILTLSTKLGYLAAGWLHLHGASHVGFVGLVYLAANAVTFLARFVIFHYVLFAGPRAASAAGSGVGAGNSAAVSDRAAVSDGAPVSDGAAADDGELAVEAAATSSGAADGAVVHSRFSQ